MNEQINGFILGLLQGMQGRGMEAFDDDDSDKRNRNWYAREVYGKKYITIKEMYQDEKLEKLND